MLEKTWNIAGVAVKFSTPTSVIRLVLLLDLVGGGGGGGEGMYWYGSVVD